MKKLLLVLISLMLLAFTGCTKKPALDQNISEDEKTAEDFVKAQGYTVMTRMGEIKKYILEKSLLYGSPNSLPYQQIWAMQTVDPDNYFGKEIIIYGFTVKNHPMQTRDDYAKKNGVKVFIMLSKGKVIGGYSFPNAELNGAYSSLDGRTLEEVTGLDLMEWGEQWKEKYSN